MALALCRRCGFLTNLDFDPALVDYGRRYDNALHFSPFFQKYESELAERLIARYALRGKHVLELGCGSGHFLGLLCSLAGATGTGFDPSHDPERADPALAGRATVRREVYTERHRDVPADLVCCRHVLEHLPEPRALLASLHRTLAGRPESVLYFEVPCAYLILRDGSIWDLMYEHCGYYVPSSLARLFERSGFEVLHVGEAYEGQFVGIEARPARPGREAPASAPETAELSRLVASFSERFRATRATWQERLAKLRAEGRRIVVWGAGGKTVGFTSLLGLGDAIDAVVDVNPGKQGSYLAGSGQPILAPEALRERRPDVVIVMNPVYRREIQAELARLGLAPEVLTP
jgi:SAM-dependent methyltransferase